MLGKTLKEMSQMSVSEYKIWLQYNHRKIGIKTEDEIGQDLMKHFGKGSNEQATIG